MKKRLRGKHYVSDEEVKTAVAQRRVVIHAFIRRGNITIERNGYYVEK